MPLNLVANILVHHPFIILIALTVFSGTCLIIPLTYRTLPNFSDPQMGFETRGTPLSNKITAWKNLLEATKPSGSLAVNPKEALLLQKFANHFKPKKKKPNKKVKAEGIIRDKLIINENRTHRDSARSNSWDKLEKIIRAENSQKYVPEVENEGFFCGPPDENYVQLVLKSEEGEDLFNFESLFRMCWLEMELTQTNDYPSMCVLTARKPKKCCRPWSLANYIALLHDRTSCLAITEEDVNSTKALLQRCAKYYHKLQLSSDCSEKTRHCVAPEECVRFDAVFNIFNYIISTSFLPPNDTTSLSLEETIIFLPVACSTATLPYYHSLEEVKLSHEGITVVAMEFCLKNTLFDEYLLRDARLMFISGMFIVLCMWIYTKSLFLTIMTIIAIVFSLGISYFLYTLVFELGFFPFMNILATIVAIGIGADDAFIFCKVWNSMKQENSSSLVKVMSRTLYHALFSMFVTSITTAVAFLASYLSSITALRCFGIFAGMAVIANYLLMISWLPATIVIWEKHCSSHCNIVKSFILVCFERWCCSSQWKLSVSKLKTSCNSLDRLWQTPEAYILNAVIRFKFFFFITLTIIAVISSIVVFYYPKLQLPNSNEFQLFDTTHLFEQYDLVYKNHFWFKRTQKSTELESNMNYKFPLRFIWGIKPEDNGNYMDPQSLGTLVLDPVFNMSHPESQQWLLSFCRDLRRQPFYQPTLGPLLPNCFIESFISWMDRRCDDHVNKNRTPCCETSKFPYKSEVFELCILDAISDLYETPTEYFIPGVAGPKFSKDEKPVIKAVVVEYDSNYSYSMSYEYVDDFLKQVDSWMLKQFETSPKSMRGGWFISDVEFYDLQRVLSESTLITVMISMGLALIVLFISTLNVLNSLYAIFTITCSIITTMALLVLSGWKLNILESVAISSTIGLTIDFSLHYTVNYKLCLVTDNRESAIRIALSNMLGPITMAALTTVAVGAIMIPSSILAYKQIGQFLVIVMVVSWIFATFHLGSLFAIAGPQGQFGQYTYYNIFCCAKEKKVESQPATISSDTHEMETLTSKVESMSHKVVQRSLSNSKTCNRNPFSDQSPSTTSAITMIMVDDN